MDGRSDPELAVAALRDAEAFGVLYDRHVAALAAFVLGRTRDAEAAADIVAETFAAALASLHRYDPARGDVGAWLHGIARNLLRRSARGRGIEGRARRRMGMPVRALDDDALAEIERLADVEVVRVRVARELAELPADERRAVHERVVLERSYEEIAIDANVSAAAVRKRVSRGVARLRARLQEEQP